MRGMFSKSRILVTGGAGFIGSNICDALIEAGSEVVCLDNFLTGRRENIEHLLDDEKFTLIEGDIRDLETCQSAITGCTHVCHQAALGSVPRSVEDPKTTNAINISGNLNVLIAAQEAGIQRFVFASSSETFGITLLEGMAIGMPIVCSNKSSLPEIFNNSGLYFDPKNDLQLSKQIDFLIRR